MKLFHTSPEAVINPKTTGLFDEFIFFSGSIYTMTAGEYHVFSTEVDEGKIISASSLWYQDNYEDAHQYVDELCDTLEIDEDDSMSLLDESKTIFDLELDIDSEDIADVIWNIQRLTAKCAKSMGFIGVQVEDEQGAAWMIDATAIEIVAE